MQWRRILVGVAVGWLVVSVIGTAAFIVQQRRIAAGWKETPAARYSHGDPAHAGNRKRVDPELAAMQYRYFPQPVAQGFEETFIRDYFQDRRGGFFLDVGASHYRDRSTTFYLDRALGWHGIAVDAIEEFAADYAKYRPRTRFFAALVSDRSDENLEFFLNTRNSRLSTIDKETASTFGGNQQVRKMTTISLDDLLDSQGVTRLDLLSMDIELWEPQALAGFDIGRFAPALVVIEAHPPVRDQLYDYFRAHDYVEVEKYTRWDGRNAYFVPAADLPAFLARPSLAD